MQLYKKDCSSKRFKLGVNQQQPTYSAALLLQQSQPISTDLFDQGPFSPYYDQGRFEHPSPGAVCMIILSRINYSRALHVNARSLMEGSTPSDKQ